MAITVAWFPALAPISPTTFPPAIVLPSLGERFVAAHVVRMYVRVDDVMDRLVGYRSYRRVDFVACPREPRVHQQHAVVARLHGDVAARAHQHVYVALHVQHVDFRVGGVPLRAGGRRLSCGSVPLCGCVCGRGAGEVSCSSDGGKAGHHDQAQILRGFKNLFRRGPHRLVTFFGGRGNVFIVFILIMYSGYIVSAPPLVASGGIP